MVTTTLGIAAASWALLMALSPILQVRMIVRRRSSEGISIAYFVVLLVGFGNYLGLQAGAVTIAASRESLSNDQRVDISGAPLPCARTYAHTGTREIVEIHMESARGSQLRGAQAARELNPL
jgi:hypothetical protein